MNKPQKGSLIYRLLVELMVLDFSNGRSVSLHKFFLKASEHYCTFYMYVYQKFISGGIESFEIYFQTSICLYRVYMWKFERSNDLIRSLNSPQNRERRRSPACHISGQSKIPGGSAWGFWWIKCHCGSWYQQADRLPTGPDAGGWVVTTILLEGWFSSR